MKPKTKRLKPAQIRMVCYSNANYVEDKNDAQLPMESGRARAVLRELGYQKIEVEQHDRWTQIEIWELPLDKQTPN